MKRRLVPCFCFFLVSVAFASCGTARVLGVSRKEASRYLENGDVRFILEARLPELPEKTGSALRELRSLIRIRPDAPFYAAILAEAAEAGDGGSVSRSALLFTVALESPSPLIRREAGEKLISLVLKSGEALARAVMSLPVNRAETDEAVTLRGACLYRLGRYSEVLRSLENHAEITDKNTDKTWNTALYLLSFWREAKRKGEEAAKEKAGREGKAFFLSGPVDSAWQWAFSQFAGTGTECFTPEEWAAVSVRYLSGLSRFSQGLERFRESGPELFFEYPELVSSLGRAFQFTPAALAEGIALFAAWEEQLRAKTVTADPALNYLVPYYLGRMYREGEEWAASSEAFQKALRAAPDPVQADACIWYILVNALAENPGAAVSQVKFYIPLMNSVSYFDDVLDRLSRFLLSGRNWNAMEEIFTLLKARKSESASRARFAWILGRAEEEDYYDPEASGFFQFIYDDEKAPLYYRALSASKLGVDLVPEAAPPFPPGRNPPGPEAEFLLGFFDFNAAAHALPFIREYESALQAAELRLIALALSDAGRTDESLNFLARGVSRGFTMEREDLRLFYPRPFRELIERCAGETGVKPELLFAVIRTESYFLPEAESRAGAIGLGQLMPATAEDMANRIARQAPDNAGRDYRAAEGIDLLDPETNLYISGFYLNYLTEILGSPALALIGYNGGLGRVRRWRNAEPVFPEDLFLETIEFEETREYGRRVTAAAVMYGYLYYGLEMNEIIADIYR